MTITTSPNMTVLMASQISPGVAIGNVTPGTGAFTSLSATGSLSLPTLGTGVRIPVGADGRMGDATLVAGAVTVTVASCTTSTRVIPVRKTNGGAIGTLTYTVAAGSFTLTSSSGTDTSVVSYVLLEPA